VIPFSLFYTGQLFDRQFQVMNLMQQRHQLANNAFAVGTTMAAAPTRFGGSLASDGWDRLAVTDLFVRDKANTLATENAAIQMKILENMRVSAKTMEKRALDVQA
jgi:hypothetical protein